MSLPNLNALEAEWAVFMENKAGPRGQWTQDQRWRADNPGELAALEAYRSGGSRPIANTATGRRMVFHLDAYLLAKAVEEPEPEPGSPPIWNGDWETGNRSQYGGLEYGGTFDGTPPASERVIVTKGIDGVTPLQGSWFAKMIVKPGDQYGSSSGWRTIFRQYEPLKRIPAGYDSWYVFACRFPTGYPNGANVWQAGPEFHQTKAPNVTVTSVAPFHFIAYADHFKVDVAGGRDGNRIEYIDIDFARGYAKNHWHVVAYRYKHGLTPNGAFELWYAPKGGTLTRIIEKSGIGTMYEQTDNYSMFGLYRAQTGTNDLVAYFDAFREYKTEADALAFARSLL